MEITGLFRCAVCKKRAPNSAKWIFQIEDEIFPVHYACGGRALAAAPKNYRVKVSRYDSPVVVIKKEVAS